MSAYLVSDDTVDYLASFATKHRGPGGRHARGPQNPIESYADADAVRAILGTSGNPSARQIAEILLAENCRSVNHRYREAANDIDGYTFNIVNDTNAATALGSISCLSYQSCECADYRDSYAFELLEGIKSIAISDITENEPWGWERPENQRKAVS